MAPKAKQVDPTVVENAWRVAIETAPLDDKEWTVKVIFIESAGSAHDRIYLNEFESFAALEKRFVIKNICKTETIFMVNQLGAEKKVKDESLRVFEEGNSYIKDKKEIPPDICALIIKHLILKIKDEYLFIRRQRLKVKEGIERESATMIDKVEVRGTVIVAAQGVTDDDVDDENKDKKFNTALRERGEEWRDKVYVDDYPVDGPNIYIAITGFVEPFLPLHLIRIGIPLTAVVQIRIDPKVTPLPPNLIRQTKRGQSQTSLLADQSLQFWNMLQSLRIKTDTCNDFKNTAFIVFSPPYCNTDELSGNPEKIYDELCFLMYDIQDLSRQHLHYLKNMDVISIPERQYDERFERYYHKLIDDIPLECITIYSVLDSILSTACADKKLDYVSAPSTPSTNIEETIYNLTDKNKKAEALIEEVFKQLCRTEVNKKHYRITFGEESETQGDPIVIDYGDIAKYNTFHMAHIYLDKIVYSSLLGLPMHRLWLTQHHLKDEIQAKLNFHINVLLSCFDRKDVETSELKRLLNILACRKLYNNRSSLKKVHLETTTISDFKKNYLKRSVFAEPLPSYSSISHSDAKIAPQTIMNNVDSDDFLNNFSDNEFDQTSSIKILFECPDISELVSAVEIANNKPIAHLIDNYDCFEDFTGITAFQIMSEAFNKFNCIDYKYCEITDSFILMFFNSHDENGISRDEWRCHLTTPLCLQDFFDYVLEENFEWIYDQELLYDANFKQENQSVHRSVRDVRVTKLCLEDTEVADDLLMEGSLKHQERMAVNEGEDQVSQSSNARTTATSSTRVIRASKSAKITTRNVMTRTQAVSSGILNYLFTKPFLGYNLGDRRVEVFGKDAIFFSKDGTKVSTKYSLTIPLNFEYIIMNITPGNSYNEFWFHKALGEFVKPEISDMCDSFRITGKDQVSLNIKKEYYEIIIENDNIFSDSLTKMIEPEHDKIPYYKLFLSWPNGLITETIHEEKSSDLSHIKQYFVSANPNPQEAMRCISLNGEVIIFKTSNEIEVYKHDGSYVKITDYYKNPIFAPEPEPIEKEKSSPKVKTKKTSKLATSFSENLKVPADYELIIDSYEYIDTNGVRRRYEKEIPSELGKLLIRTATDFTLGEIFSKRLDGTTTLLNKDGVFIATFPDKTRIITYYVVSDEEVYPEWTDDERVDINISDIEVINNKSFESQSGTESTYKTGEEEESYQYPPNDGYIFISLIYTIEHHNFSTVTINKSTDSVSIESPNNMTVTIDNNNHYIFSLDNLTTAEFDGEYLNISYEACPECKSITTCNVKVKDPSPGEYTDDQGWVKVQDSFSKKIFVDDEGAIIIQDDISTEHIVQTDEHPDEMSEQPIVLNVNEPENIINVENEDDKTVDAKSEASMISHGNCRLMYLAKTMRFFVLKRDLTCSELVHRALLDKYEVACQWQPWCSINKYPTFGDHRSTVSILTPIHLTESEKWRMASKLSDKPKYLTYKDLSKEPKKGYYHWMRPYERFTPKPIKVETVLPPRLPRAFVLRTLEQQWDLAEAEECKGGKELLRAILNYRKVMESGSETAQHIPLRDDRTDEERCADEYVQDLGHQILKNRIYKDLKQRLEDDLSNRAKINITTEPLPPSPVEEYLSNEASAEVPMGEQAPEEEETQSEELLKQTDVAETMSPKLKQYWRRRAEEYKEEQFFKYILRMGVIPPYFKNKEGGIWWSLKELANKAVDKSERRRKAKCVCVENSTDKTETPVDRTPTT